MLFSGMPNEEPPPLVVEEERIAWQYVCNMSSTKTYMDYKAITNRSSKQYKYIQENMEIRNGLLYDKDGSIGVALGSWWGDIGSKWTIELSNGQIYDVVKIDEKADRHTINGCQHISDGSVIEFVIDSKTIPANWWGGNGLVWNGNFNNYQKFNGSITRIGKKIIEEVEIDISKFLPRKQEYKIKRPYLKGLFLIYS